MIFAHTHRDTQAALNFFFFFLRRAEDALKCKYVPSKVKGRKKKKKKFLLPPKDDAKHKPNKQGVDIQRWMFKNEVAVRVTVYFRSGDKKSICRSGLAKTAENTSTTLPLLLLYCYSCLHTQKQMLPLLAYIRYHGNPVKRQPS